MSPCRRLRAAGVDLGSSAVKVAVLETRGDGEPVLLASEVERIRKRDPRVVAEALFRSTCAAAETDPEALDYVASTGEAQGIPFETGHFFGMTTHARGGLFLVPEAAAVLDVGALHARAVAVAPDGRVLRTRMTGQCASGSGQFLENIARYLGVALEDVGPLSLRARKPESVSGICAVLAETDVINMVSRGVETADILRGIHESIAKRLAQLLRSLEAGSPVVLTGGLAADEGLAAALAERLAADGAKTEVRTHRLSDRAGAIGAAIWGAVRRRRLGDAASREAVA